MVTIILGVIAAILAITLHEAAHGYAALAMGDDTARRMGRLSLNPLVHIDRFGTIILPGMLAIFQLVALGHIGFMFGWAKPVPVAAWKFRNPRRGMMFVAAAGPAMNFLLALLGGVALHLAPLLPLDVDTQFQEFLLYFLLSNLVLGLFNLLPIPPLDGGRILVGLLPASAAQVVARLERAGIVIVLLVVFLLPQAMAEIFHVDFNPFGEALDNLVPRAMEVVMHLTGNPV